MPSLDDQQAHELVTRLLKHTDDYRDLVWNVGGQESWYWAEKGRYTYAIHARDRDNSHPFILGVHPRPAEGESGEPAVLEVSSEEIQDTATVRLLHTLFMAAKRSAEDVDATYQDVLDDLDAEPF